MDFDDLDGEEETMEPKLLEILERYAAPDFLIDVFGRHNIGSCLNFALIAEEAEVAWESVQRLLQEDEKAYKGLRVLVRNVWRAARAETQEECLAQQEERRQMGGVLLQLLNGNDPSKHFILPAAWNAKVGTIKEMLAGYLGIYSSSLDIVVKGNGVEKTLQDTVVITNQVFVRGITTFERPRREYSHPFVVIGAGHMGLRMALMFCQENIHDYIQFEKLGDIGGNAWLGHANLHSKVQSELGTYHLDYSEKNACPVGLPPWLSRDELLTHFKQVADKWGLFAQMRCSTEVMKFTIAENLDTSEKTYAVEVRISTNEVKTETVMGSSINYFPGNLTLARRDTYPGEADFGGSISYGMWGETQYELVTGEPVAILGMGAFGIENVRTCVEHHASKIYLISRKRNLAMPRMISWWLNNSIYPVAGPTMMHAMEKAYSLFGEDPWTYHSVMTNTGKTLCTISQSARFGIGDIYFLSRHYGKTEVIEASVKKLSKNMVHLDNKQSVKVTVLIKCFGFDPDWSGDTLMQCTQLTGNWVDGDHRRSVVSDLRSVHASNFGGTSLSPGAISQCFTFLYVLWYPSDFDAMMKTGMCPTHKADTKNGYPAIVLDAKVGTTMSILVGSLIPWIGDKLNSLGSIKREKNLGCHSMEVIQKAAEDEWIKYCQLFFDEGDQRPFPKYPYTIDVLKNMVDEQDREGFAKQSR